VIGTLAVNLIIIIQLQPHCIHDWLHGPRAFVKAGSGSAHGLLDSWTLAILECNHWCTCHAACVCLQAHICQSKGPCNSSLRAGTLLRAAAGKLMAAHFLKLNTMASIVDLGERPSLPSLLRVICGAEEFKNTSLRRYLVGAALLFSGQPDDRAGSGQT